jgi:hypothetical protein
MNTFLKNKSPYFAKSTTFAKKIILVMSKIKGQKLYVLLCEYQIIGIWSNLSILVRELSTINAEDKTALYLKIYRQLKKHTEGGEIFTYNFKDSNGNTYQIKVEKLQ